MPRKPPEQHGQRFTVYRQDDNGATARIREFAVRAEAQAFLEELEARGHKQYYWLESSGDSASAPSPARPS